MNGFYLNEYYFYSLKKNILDSIYFSSKNIIIISGNKSFIKSPKRKHNFETDVYFSSIDDLNKQTLSSLQVNFLINFF